MFIKTISFFFGFCLFLLSIALKGQETDSYSSPFLLDTRINLLAPHPLGNAAFMNTFNGVYTVSGSENVHLFQNFYVGICGGNSLYQVPQYTLVSGAGVNTTNYINTLCQMNFIGLNLGHDYYFAPKGFLSSAISVGQNFSKFTDVQYVTKVPIEPLFSAAYVQVSGGIHFVVEDQMGLGFTISYLYINHQFNPDDIALNQYKGYGAGDSKGNISAFEVGFTIYLGYVKKKR